MSLFELCAAAMVKQQCLVRSLASPDLRGSYASFTMQLHKQRVVVFQQQSVSSFVVLVVQTTEVITLICCSGTTSLVLNPSSYYGYMKCTLWSTLVHVAPFSPGSVLLQEGAAGVQQGEGDFGWTGDPRQAPCTRAADGE